MLQTSDERFQAPQRSWFDAVANSWAIHVAANQPAFFENLEVLRDRGLRKWQLLDDLAAHTTALPYEDAKDLYSGWVSDRPRQLRQLIVGFRPLHWT